jgi:hypothetical protein
MSTTVGTLEKKVETVFENLSPVEKAKYVYDETWRIADRKANSEDEEAHQQEIERFFYQHVATLSAVDYIKFLIADDKLNTRKWAGMHFTSTLMAYDREDCLLDLLIIDMDLLDHLLSQKGKKKGKGQGTNQNRNELIEQYRERRAAILKDAKVIWKDDFWERERLSRPDLSPEFLKAIEADNELPSGVDLSGR